MNKLIACAVVAILACSSHSAFADGLFHRLPEDGTWSRYATVGNSGGADQHGELTIKSVGKVTVDGVACRWVEAVFSGPSRTVALKLLVPEEKLSRGGSPWQDAKKILLNNGTGTAREITSDEAASLGPIPLFFGGPLTDPQAVDAEKVTTSAGEFACEGVSGQYEFNAGDQKVDIVIDSRFSDTGEAGFGVVTHKIAAQLASGGISVLELTLEQIGTDATATIEGNH